MKRLIFTLTLIILLGLPCFSVTEEEARNIAFNDTEIQLQIELFKNYLYDVYSDNHIDDAKHGIYTFTDYTVNGEITGTISLYYFLDELDYYTLQYDEHPAFLFEYDYRGYLRHIIFRIPDYFEYPIKRMRYDSNGRLVKILVLFSQKESFIFDGNKKMIIHWIGDKAYNSKGKRIRVFKSTF